MRHKRSRRERRPSAERGSYARSRAAAAHPPGCIGCPLISLPYGEQLRLKRERVARAFASYATLSSIHVPAVSRSPRELGYRGRVKLVVRKSRGAIAAGLYLPGTHHVMDISSCPVHPPVVNRVVQLIKYEIAELGIAPYDERDDSGQLRYLDLRYSFARRELSLTLVTRRAAFPEGKQLARRIKARFPFVAGVMQNINPSRGNVIWGEEQRVLLGRDFIVEKLGALELELPANVFSQINPFTAAMLYEKVVELAGLTGREAVVDLYCGAGPIAFTLARAAREIWAIDDDAASIAAAERNAHRNAVANCRFVSGDAAEQLLRAKARLSKIGLIVANPPRKGIQRPALEAIVAASAPAMIYVSCEPKTLARDLDILVGAGYAVRSVQPFDMFPQTEEVETVALLKKA